MAAALVNKLDPWKANNGLYQENELIGCGGYGTVYKGRNILNGYLVAIKKHCIPYPEEGIPQSILREISTIKLLQKICKHPNLVTLHEIEYELSPNKRDLNFRLVMEYCEYDLATYMATMASRPLRLINQETIWSIVGQMLSAIAYLHLNSVVHRDLKPQNVLMNPDGIVKLCDFGLARFYSLQSTMSPVVVTLWYRAPEVLLQCNYDSSVDMWSMGCIFAELHNLSALFPGTNEQSQLNVIFEKIGLPALNSWPKDAIVPWFSFSKYRDSLQVAASSLLRAEVPLKNKQLLDALLLFDARKRISATAALQQFCLPALK